MARAIPSRGNRGKQETSVQGDINDKFLTKDGFLSKKIMPDYLHPNEAGYKIWAEAIESKVAELMGEKSGK